MSKAVYNCEGGCGARLDYHGECFECSRITAAQKENDWLRKREDDAINRAVLAASIAIENTIPRNVAWKIPYGEDSREKIESFVREVLLNNLRGVGPRAER